MTIVETVSSAAEMKSPARERARRQGRHRGAALAPGGTTWEERGLYMNRVHGDEVGPTEQIVPTVDINSQPHVIDSNGVLWLAVADVAGRGGESVTGITVLSYRDGRWTERARPVPGVDEPLPDGSLGAVGAHAGQLRRRDLERARPGGES